MFDFFLMNSFSGGCSINIGGYNFNSSLTATLVLSNVSSGISSIFNIQVCQITNVQIGVVAALFDCTVCLALFGRWPASCMCDVIGWLLFIYVKMLKKCT